MMFGCTREPAVPALKSMYCRTAVRTSAGLGGTTPLVIPVDVAGRLRFEIVGVAEKGQCAHLVCEGGDAFEPPRRVVQRGSGVQRIQSHHGQHGHDADGREPQPGSRVVIRVR